MRIDHYRQAADLQWLAYLLTGDREQGIELAVEAVSGRDGEFFEQWMRAWSRRVVIAKALRAASTDIAASARRVAVRRPVSPSLPDRGWQLDADTTKGDLESALLAIDSFPRAVVLLSLFEGVPVEDVAVLLDATPALVKKAQAIGVQDLTRELAIGQGWMPSATIRFERTSGSHCFGRLTRAFQR